MRPNRKAAPFGAMAGALAASSFLTSSAVGAHELRAQEEACGMLAPAREMASGTHTNARPRPQAIVKAQTADFQSNEIASDGAAATLVNRPRARWRKISRNKTLLVEDDHSPFSDPQKSLQPRVQHHGEYVRRLGRLPRDTPVLSFVLYNDGYAFADVMHRFSYEIGVPADAVHLCAQPAGGFFGCATQFGACVGVTREQIAHVSRHYNLHPLLFDPRAYHPVEDLTRLSCTAPAARVHRLVLRHTTGTEADVRATLQSLATSGFVNYYGLEHFGCGGSTLFDMAHFAAAGDYLRAVGCYLQMLADTDPLHHARYVAYLNADDGTTPGIAEQWALQCRAARVQPNVTRVIDALAAFHQRARSGDESANAREVWLSVPVHADAERAAAKTVWNVMASQRILLERDRAKHTNGDESGTASSSSPALVGDVVQRRDGSYGTVTTEAEAAAFTLADVVLPVPYGGTLASPRTLFPAIAGFDRGLYEAVAARRGLSSLLDARAVDSVTCEYRHVLQTPRHLQAAVVPDPNSLFALKTDLFLLQEHKQPGALTLDFAQRAREPCVYNVSERFAERMQSLKAVNPGGSQSVAVSFVLNGDASPFVALREAFDLRYATVQDLYPL